MRQFLTDGTVIAMMRNAASARILLVLCVGLCAGSAYGANTAQGLEPAEAEEITVTAAPPVKTPTDKIIITRYDITDRPYHSLEYISLSLRQEGRLDPPTTPETLAQALRKRAARLGADAVILTRFSRMSNYTNAAGLAVVTELAKVTVTPPAAERSAVAPAATVERAPSEDGPIICDAFATGRAIIRFDLWQP